MVAGAVLRAASAHPLLQGVGVVEARDGGYALVERGRVVYRLESRRFRLADCAVLYRTHAQSRALEEQFVRSGVPFRIVGGIRFYERREIMVSTMR